MSVIDPELFFQELHQDLVNRDRTKIRYLIDNLDHIEPGRQKLALDEIASDCGELGDSMLGYAASRPNVDAAQALESKNALRPRLLDNPELLCRFLRENEFREKRLIVELAAEEHPDRAGACLAGWAGEDDELNGSILDCLAARDGDAAFGLIVSALNAPNAFLRNRAKEKLFERGRAAVPYLVANLRRLDSEQRVHSLNVLGQIGDPSAALPIRKLLRGCPSDPNERFAAYEALGRMKLSSNAFSLVEGLEDSSGHVVTAAAQAIEQNCGHSMLSGIRNLLNGDKAFTQRIVAAFIDGSCSKIVLGLLDHPGFCGQALDYLKGKAHPEIRSQFQALFVSHGRPELAELAAAGDGEAEKADRPLVWVVDDSRMVLRIYRQTLHSLGCDSVLFERPGEVLEALEKGCPGMLFTDLNMPGMTGIELTRRLRQRCDSAALPVVMVTTQGESADYVEARKAGVDDIIAKPFDESAIGRMLGTYLGTGRSPRGERGDSRFPAADKTVDAKRSERGA